MKICTRFLLVFCFMATSTFAEIPGFPEKINTLYFFIEEMVPTPEVVHLWKKTYMNVEKGVIRYEIYTVNPETEPDAKPLEEVIVTEDTVTYLEHRGKVAVISNRRENQYRHGGWDGTIELAGRMFGDNSIDQLIQDAKELKKVKIEEGRMIIFRPYDPPAFSPGSGQHKLEFDKNNRLVKKTHFSGHFGGGESTEEYKWSKDEETGFEYVSRITTKIAYENIEKILTS